jgi:hypothetical protein
MLNKYRGYIKMQPLVKPLFLSLVLSRSSSRDMFSDQNLKYELKFQEPLPKKVNTCKRIIFVPGNNLLSGIVKALFAQINVV